MRATTWDDAVAIDIGFVFESAPFESCHASTIAATPEGLVAAWFAGSGEGGSDVGIWTARREAGRWQPPREVATGRQESGRRHPCWNPVLFRPAGGPLLLFYKVGPRPSRWWGMVMTSPDEGRSWSRPERLPDGILGPIKNKPVALRDGTLISPSSTEHDGWRVHLELSADGGRTWRSTGPLNSGRDFKAIQPSVLEYPSGELQVLCRSRQGVLTECRSADSGETWSAMCATVLPNPDSGADAVMLRDGRALLIYNHAVRERTPINLAVSSDGHDWRAGPLLEEGPGEFSYPAIIQDEDGTIHATYTWMRQRIRHVTLEPEDLVLRELPAGG